MADIEEERIALRALALLPIEELPDYSDDAATTQRVATVLRGPTGSLSAALQGDLEKTLDDSGGKVRLP